MKLLIDAGQGTDSFLMTKGLHFSGKFCILLLTEANQYSQSAAGDG